MAHGVGTCAINGLYKLLCGDPEAGVDGMVPRDTDLHAERFQRFEGEGALEDRVGKGFDRLVQITYEGTAKWAGIWNRGQLERTFKVIVRIGYFYGDHEDLTDCVIADDEHDFAKLVRKDQLWPNCAAGCIGGFVTKTSSISKYKPDRKINEIAVEVTVTE